MRPTTGIFTCRSFAAATTPVARTSQRRMPPKMLMRTALTPAALSRIRNACLACSPHAPPPTSRELAGLAGEAQPEGELPRVIGLGARGGVDGFMKNRVWIFLGNFLDFNASRGARHKDDASRRAIH